MSARETISNIPQNSDNLPELLRAFLDTHDLGLEQLAGLLRITPQTLEAWFNESTTPPACLLALAVLIDSGQRVSRRYHQSQWFLLPRRGAQLNKGHEEQMLRMVRAI